MTTTTTPSPCFACGHAHLDGSPGECWEAACNPACPAHADGSSPFPYEPTTA